MTTPRTLAEQPEVERLREALTPSGSTKAAYHGEFSFQLFEGVSSAGIDQYRKVYVPWDTVKEIMAAIKARALSASPSQQPDSGEVEQGVTAADMLRVARRCTAAAGQPNPCDGPDPHWWERKAALDDAATILTYAAALASTTPASVGAMREARTARDLFEIARPCFHYAPRGTPDGFAWERSETGRLLMKAMEKIAALSKQSEEAPDGEVVQLRQERDAALRECAKWAREAGEAKGRLETSEWPGVVEGWKERALKAEALATPSGQVPDGRVLVPREPTEEMLRAGCGPWTPSTRSIPAVYRAMIATANPVEGEER